MLVEGNLDVIASHQIGVRQVVATAGTALTEPHLKALSRFTSDIRLSFDADKAGLAATERAIPIASRAKVSLSMIDLPSGKDPDELIKQDPKLWEQAIQKHSYALDWLMARYQKLLDVDSALGKREYSDVLLPVVRGLSDDVERDHYLTSIASVIGVSKEALNQKFQKTAGPELAQRRRRVKIEPARLDKIALENQKTQDNFLSLMLTRPTLREFLELITPEMLYTDSGRALLELLKTNPGFDGKKAVEARHTSHEARNRDSSLQPRDSTAAEPEAENTTTGPNTVQSLGDYVKIESLLYEELYQGLELNELHYEAARLQARLIARFVKSKKQALVYELETADEAVTQNLLLQAKKYDQLLNQVKGAARGESERQQAG